MTDICWDEAFCSEGANCFRFGLDDQGRAYIGSTAYVSDSMEALRALISAVKAGAADHLLRPRPRPPRRSAPSTPTAPSAPQPGAGRSRSPAHRRYGWFAARRAEPRSRTPGRPGTCVHNVT